MIQIQIRSRATHGRRRAEAGEIWETDQDPRKGAATDGRIVPWSAEKKSEKALSIAKTSYSRMGDTGWEEAGGRKQKKKERRRG